MKAVILAGGKGTRLKPFTYVLPKPLVPVGEKPILALLVEQLKKFDFTDIVLCVNHMAELIMAYFGDGSKLGVQISYSMEDKPLSTVAPLRLVPNLPENFLVVNGDILTDLDFASFFAKHCNSGAMVTVATCTRQFKVDFGVMDLQGTQVVGFREKPEYEFPVSMGVYAFNRRVLELVPDDRAFGFDQLMHLLLAQKKTIAVYPYTGYWLDIGRIEDFERANAEYRDTHSGLCK
jgi:NDP-mannose synthase